MNRLEMINAVERLFVADGDEAELHMLRQKLKEALPHSNISDLIYYPENNLNAEQVIEQAMQREENGRVPNSTR